LKRVIPMWLKLSIFQRRLRRRHAELVTLLNGMRSRCESGLVC
jgi:hypothetical protein